MAFNTNEQVPLFGEANQVRPLFGEANQMWSTSSTPNQTPRSEGVKHENSYTGNEIVPKKEQTVSSPFLPSYTKSYSQTRFEVTTSDHTWKIDEFGRLAAIVDTLNSPPFGENKQYKIQMNISRQDLLCAIRISIRTNTSFRGSCTTTIMHPPETVLASRSTISCRISDMTLLINVSDDSYISTEAFIIHCKIEHFNQLISNTIHMNLQLPLPPTVFKEIKLSENSTFPVFDFQSKNEEKSIKFIIGEEQYVISKKLLCDTNSSYFKYMCLTHKETEKDMTSELVTDNEIELFKQVLFYITTDSIDQGDYGMLKTLLTAADKYDVQTLKLTCQHYLLHYIKIENAVELLQFALSSNAKNLETHSANFIKLHMKEIRDTIAFKSLSQEDLNKIMELIDNSKFEVSTDQFSLSLPETQCFPPPKISTFNPQLPHLGLRDPARR